MSTDVACTNCGQAHAIPSGRDGMHFHCKKCGCVNEISSRFDHTSSYALAPAPKAEVEALPSGASQAAEDRRSSTRRNARVLSISTVVALPSRLERESVWLVVLSLADLLLTYALLRRGAGFYESNPVAQWFFARWNITGMTLFKFGLIAMIIVMGEIIESKRPGWGRAILGLGCASAAVVVVYSIKLLTT